MSYPTTMKHRRLLDLRYRKSKRVMNMVLCCLIWFLFYFAQFTLATRQGDAVFYREAFNQVVTPTIILDDKFRIVDLTESYINALRSTREQCVGRNVIELIRERLSNREADRMIDAIKLAHSKRTSQIIEIVDSRQQHYWNVHVRPWPQDRPRRRMDWMRSILKPKRFSREHSTVMMTLQSTDLTTIVDHNARMTNNAVSADIYHMLVNSIEDFAIFMLDTEGYVKTWNKGAERLYQYTAGEICGRHFTVFMKPDDDGAEVELTEAKSGQRRHMEAWRVKKDGTAFWASISIAPLYSSSHLHLGFVKATQDLTPRLLSEQARIEAHEQAATMKTDFLAQAAHEFRSPLVGVKIGIELLAESNPTPEQAEIMSGILESGRVLTDLINHLLDYNKYRVGAAKLSTSNIMIRNVIDNLVRNYRQRTRVPIYVRVGPNVPAVLLGDGTKLQQVLSNLIDNAVKYTHSGSITITCQVRTRSSNQLPTLSAADIMDDAAVVPLMVTVKDTGMGLSDEEMLRLFKPFGQSDATLHGTYGGTGLGLSICKECVQLMNGRIWVDSVKGKGSTFSFTMDLAVGRRPSLQSPTIEKQDEVVETTLPSIPAKILVVDDNAINRRMIVQMLRMSGMNPIPFTDGLEVVAYFQNLIDNQISPYPHDHIVTMDCQMPGMNGLDATRAIHAMPGLENVPIIGLTANVFTDDQASCRGAGMMGFISKPFKKQDLLQVIHEAAVMLATLQ